MTLWWILTGTIILFYLLFITYCIGHSHGHSKGYLQGYEVGKFGRVHRMKVLKGGK